MIYYIIIHFINQVSLDTGFYIETCTLYFTYILPCKTYYFLLYTNN